MIAHHQVVDPPAESSSDLFRLLVETVRDYAIFALDPAGHIITWNPGARRFKGYEASEIIGRHFSVFYTPEDLAIEKPRRELEEAVRSGWVEDVGWRLRKDGSRFWADVVITALRDPTGTLVGFAKVTRDLTDRRVAEEALRQSEERFRRIVQSVRDYGIFMLDQAGHVVSWNEGAERMQGYTTDEIVGRHFSVFYRPDEAAAGRPDEELRIATSRGWYEEEGWRVRKDGSSFWAHVVLTALRGDAGDLIGFTKVTRDLTERRRAHEAQLENARRTAAAEAANRAKSEFLAAMSHELRTPLNAIGGYVDLIAMGVRGPVTPEQAADLARVRRSQQHLLGIINDLLNYARIEAGGVTYDIGPVSVRTIIETAVTIATPLAAGKGVNFNPPDDVDDLVARADAPKVDQILVNLLSNAVKFTDRGGSVSLEVRREGEWIVMEVRDTGLGIPAEKLETIFEPFVQVGRSLTTQSEGTGLGLAISQDLARAMGGSISVQSSLGEGSTFRLELPAAG
jgi:PAS domain S-box-containing protein